jgi:hypothetical protein
MYLATPNIPWPSLSKFLKIVWNSQEETVIFLDMKSKDLIFR